MYLQLFKFKSQTFSLPSFPKNEPKKLSRDSNIDSSSDKEENIDSSLGTSLFL